MSSGGSVAREGETPLENRRGGEIRLSGWTRGFAGEEVSRRDLLDAHLRSIPSPGRLCFGLRELSGVGSKTAEAAERIGIEDLGDLIEHYPHSYGLDEGVIPIAQLADGVTATLQVEVRSASSRPTRRRGLRIVEATVFDDTGSIKVAWFNQAWLAEKLTPGTRLLLRGKRDRRGFKPESFEVLSPKGEQARPPDPIREPAFSGAPPGLHTCGLVPTHPAGEGVRTAKLREWVHAALAHARDVIEPLPAWIRVRRSLALAADARVAIHFPLSEEAARTARRRLAYEDLFIHQAALLLRREGRKADLAAAALDPAGDLATEWVGSLPFEPTEDQRSAFAEIDADLAGVRPMQRLLMGEVGSGKTVVALYAMLRAYEAGHQAVLMAPTETLAEQHFATLETLLAGSGIPIALLTGSTSAATRRRTLGVLATGELPLLVGTHALIEPAVEFARLAVAVVDEQHRFGVRQRRALDRKGAGDLVPHVLHMTATPIPRTLSLVAYGDLDVTALHGLPSGRQPIKTWLVGEDRRAGAYEFVRERLGEGRQAYVVCPLVEESEKDEAKAVTAEAERLASGEFADFSVQLIHGQMPAREKSAAMARFNSGEADVLVATSVIEVGIDVANATVMLIEGAERYGISQLHQLRGRIGRGSHDSQCILFAEPRTPRARARLDALVRERDGFRLAEEDLRLRGEGEVLGTLQSGLPRFRAAVLPEDDAILIDARADLLEVLDRLGSLEHPELGPLLDVVRSRYGDERQESIAG